MDIKLERHEVQILFNVEGCLQALTQKTERFPRKNLTRREKFTSAKAAFNFKRALRQGRHAQSKAPQLAAALETLLPLYRRGYGELGLLKSLSPLAKRQESIDLLRQAGAAETAALCAEARKRELRDAAVRRENAPFLRSIWKKFRDSEATAATLIKKEPRKSRGSSLKK